ncbi:MAG: aquaporin [Phycisphaerales bacterium]|nr:aquaporin [Phycisphaerales bacterium]
MTRGTVRRARWPLYVLEALELGVFMIAASASAIVLFHPASPVVSGVPLRARQILMGLAMGATAIGLIHSPWGRRSGAHMNPGVTLAFLRLGKIAPSDALGYIAFQFAGGTAAMVFMRLLFERALMDGAVRYVATVPAGSGARAVLIAWLAEFAMAWLLMMTVLVTGNRPRASRFTGVLAGALVATYIVVEAPLSGMSINPARTFASAIVGDIWTAWWIYFSAPPLGMLAAAQLYVWLAGTSRVYCAKLYHDRTSPCPFRCRFHELLVGDGHADAAPAAPPIITTTSTGPLR